MKEENLFNYSWLKQINTNYFHHNSFTLDLETRTTFWNTTSSLFFIWVCHSAFSQSNVQRLTSCTTLRTAQKSMIYLIVGVALIMLSTCGNGIIMYAYYYFCDPVKAGIVSKYDKLTSRFVQDVTGHIPGMSGIANRFNLFPLSNIFTTIVQHHFRRFHFVCIQRFIEHRIRIVAFVIRHILQWLHSTTEMVCRHRRKCKSHNESDNYGDWSVLCVKWLYHWTLPVGFSNDCDNCWHRNRCHCRSIFTWSTVSMGKQTGGYSFL